MATEKRPRRFSGTSNKGNFEEALERAIEAAKAGGADVRVTWKLLVVHGVSGGIIGQNDLTVEIEATLS